MDTQTTLKQSSIELATLKSLVLTQRQLCDLECLLNKSYAPLDGFLDEENYNSVCEVMRLCNGTLWPMPITLDVTDTFASQLQIGESIILSNVENTPLALLKITAIWQPDKAKEAQQVFGTTDLKHPAVQYLYELAGNWYVGGVVTQLTPPLHYDFIEYRYSPEQLKQYFQLYGWKKIIAFQTRNPMHRAHYELTRRAAESTHAHLLIHPVVGMTKPGDVDYVTRVKCYIQMLEKYPHQSATLCLLPLAMRMGGPREALWHALIRKNYGVTHFIVGRDHAGPGLNSLYRPFYEPYAAQELLLQYSDEIEMEIVCSPAIVYTKEKQQFIPINEVEADDIVLDISGTELRTQLKQGLDIPEWFTFPEIKKILQTAYPPLKEQGFTLLFTGLSGAGKSTLAKAVQAKLLETTSRSVTLLDGDILRHYLSSELGFSKSDRDTHIRRVGFVASEITKHKGIALCAAIAPYAETRHAIRNLINQHGGFVEVYVETPLEVCKQRDVKGLYKKAEQGLIKGVTGIDDPYEVPNKPEIVIDTSTISLPRAVELIFTTLHQLGYI